MKTIRCFSDVASPGTQPAQDGNRDEGKAGKNRARPSSVSSVQRPAKSSGMQPGQDGDGKASGDGARPSSASSSQRPTKSSDVQQQLCDGGDSHRYEGQT